MDVTPFARAERDRIVLLCAAQRWPIPAPLVLREWMSRDDCARRYRLARDGAELWEVAGLPRPATFEEAVVIGERFVRGVAAAEVVLRAEWEPVCVPVELPGGGPLRREVDAREFRSMRAATATRRTRLREIVMEGQWIGVVWLLKHFHLSVHSGAVIAEDLRWLVRDSEGKVNVQRRRVDRRTEIRATEV